MEFGVVASLGRRPPMSVVRLADAGQGQISRALAGRNRRLLEQLDRDEVRILLDHIDRLIRKAEAMPVVEKELG